MRSRSLTELTSQITPPNKNGHAPPPIESRKSSQSVNPYYLWTCFFVLSQIKPHAPLLGDQIAPFHIRPGRIATPYPLPPDNFKHSLTLFSKSFSSLPCGTCSLQVSRPYLALGGIYRLIGTAFQNNPTCRQHLVVGQGPGTTGLSPSMAPLSWEFGHGPSLRKLLQNII
ncbi:LOW QUALITY PROTEIN: hypothetical protein N665_4441s0001 [Sinapis alba]|nr:LOW QUALITY PROTEIN: hypothetical protein N665_4441s0001 [Sinapis alba]